MLGNQCVASDMTFDDQRDRPQAQWLPWLPRLSRALDAAEKKIGITATGLIVGMILFLIATIYVTPGLELTNNGQYYGGLATDLLKSHDNPFAHRILSPFVAHYLNLRGKNFIFFPLIVSIIFLGEIYRYFRRQGYPNLGALVASSTMAFSSPVLFLLHFQGYTDILSHLLFFWCFVARRSIFVWVIALALACLNHEASLFSIPWIVLLRTRYYGCPLLSGKGVLRLLRDILFVAVAVGPMVLLRKLAPLDNTGLAPAAYWALLDSAWKAVIQFASFGSFMAFKAFWFLPFLGLLAAERGSRIFTLLLFFTIFFAGAGQLIVSGDTSRHLGHAFPMILYSLELIFKKIGDDLKVLEGLTLLVVCNFLVPQCYVGRQHMIAFIPTPVSFILWLLGFDPWNLFYFQWS